MPDPEVGAKPKRRRFSADYKRRILKEADACRASGEIGALLRREGLYSSHLTTWRKQRDKGVEDGLRPKKRGRKPKAATPEAKRIAELEARVRRLEREKSRLEVRLHRADLVIDIQKKACDLLGIVPPEPPASSGDAS